MEEIAPVRSRPRTFEPVLNVRVLPRFGLTLVLPLALAACEHPFGIGRAFVDGDWIYAAEATGSGAICDISGLMLALDQDGDRFAGVAEGGTLGCVVTAATMPVTVTRALDGMPVTSGEIDGSRVSFVLGPQSVSHRGSVEGRSMTGTIVVTLQMEVGAPLVLEGTFAASREPREEEEGL